MHEGVSPSAWINIDNCTRDGLMGVLITLYHVVSDKNIVQIWVFKQNTWSMPIIPIQGGFWLAKHLVWYNVLFDWLKFNPILFQNDDRLATWPHCLWSPGTSCEQNHTSRILIDTNNPSLYANNSNVLRWLGSNSKNQKRIDRNFSYFAYGCAISCWSKIAEGKGGL